MKERTLKILDHVVEYGVYGFIFMLPFSTAGVSIFSGLAAAAFLARQVITPDFSVMRTNKVFFLILAGFFFFMALSLLNSGPLLDISLRAFFIKWGRFVLILWIILHVFRSPERIIRILWVFVASAVLLATTTLSQKFFGVEFLCRRPLSGVIITGPFKNQNSLAGYLTPLVPVLFAFALWKWEQVSRKTGLLFLSTLFVGLSFLTFCRGGWVGSAAGLLFLLLLLNKDRLGKKLFFFLAAFLGGVGVPLFAWALLMFQGRGDGARGPLFEGAWLMIQESPFLGKGLGTFMSHCMSYAHYFAPYYAHNCYLQIWAESGIFSLIFFLSLLGFVFFKSLQVLLQAPASLPAFILAGLTSGFLAISIHLFSDTHLYSLQISFLFWTILGLTYALTRIMEQERAQPQ